MNNYVKDEETILEVATMSSSPYVQHRNMIWKQRPGIIISRRKDKRAKSKFLSKDEIQKVIHSDKINSQYVDQHTSHVCAVGLCP